MSGGCVLTVHELMLGGRGALVVYAGDAVVRATRGCCETQEQCPALLGWLGWWGGEAESEGSPQDVGPLLHADKAPLRPPDPPPPAGLSEKGTLLAVTRNIGSPLNCARN